MKSYNTIALRGNENFTDHDFQAEMSELGIDIPDELLYTPKLNDHVLNAMNQQTVNEMIVSKNPLTNQPYTRAEAQAEADQYTALARQNINQLMKL